MTRWAPRLTWDLTRVLLAQKLFGASRHPVALHLDLAQYPAHSQVDSPDANNSTPDSSRDSHVLAAVRASTAPFVWIGGDAPLRYPRIGQIARQIISFGKIVFMEMDGTLLRRRIHEFRPESRLYLVLPLHGSGSRARFARQPRGKFSRYRGEHPHRQAVRLSHLRGNHAFGGHGHKRTSRAWRIHFEIRCRWLDPKKLHPAPRQRNSPPIKLRRRGN